MVLIKSITVDENYISYHWLEKVFEEQEQVQKDMVTREVNRIRLFYIVYPFSNVSPGSP